MRFRGGKARWPLMAIREGDPETGTLIGSCSLLPRDVKEGEGEEEGEMEEAELGYWLHPEWQGKGVMRGAVRGVMEWGFRDGGVKVCLFFCFEEGDGGGGRWGGWMLMRVQKAFVRVMEENVGSRKVVESVEGWKRNEGRVSLCFCFLLGWMMGRGIDVLMRCRMKLLTGRRGRVVGGSWLGTGTGVQRRVSSFLSWVMLG